MKISKMGTSALPPLADREGGGKTDRTNGFFAAELMKAADKQAKERLQSLLADITAQGKRLSQAPTYSELKAYRELVRKFVGEAVGNMYSLQSQTGWDRHGRQKMFTIIKQIDDTLASLTEDVRQGQERQLAILEKLDAVRGMLVDLYS
ncbi:MAG: YaaR family protein [Negativicutes bacterium]|nr:YaaR family protein [Negativicutes bacterium]